MSCYRIPSLKEWIAVSSSTRNNSQIQKPRLCLDPSVCHVYICCKKKQGWKIWGNLQRESSSLLVLCFQNSGNFHTQKARGICYNHKTTSYFNSSALFSFIDQ